MITERGNLGKRFRTLVTDRRSAPGRRQDRDHDGGPLLETEPVADLLGIAESAVRSSGALRGSRKEAILWADQAEVLT